MENVYTSFEFTKFTNFSQKHGWLSKRSNGVTNILKRKRYFVLTKSALYWFIQDKSRFLLKGVLCHDEGEWLGYNDKSVNLKNGHSGKTYILSGKDIFTWVDLLRGVFETPVKTRRSSAGTSQKKQHFQSLRSFQTCPDVFRSDSSKISEVGSRSSASASGHLSLASSTNSGPSSVLSDPDEDEQEALLTDESESVAEGFGEPILPEPRMEHHLNTIRDAIDEQTMREFHENLDEQFMRGRVISVTSPAPDCVDHLVFEPNSPSYEENEDESESGSSSCPARHKKAPSVLNAVAFFEGLNVQCARKKRKRCRKLSNRRRQIYGDSSSSMSQSVEKPRQASIAKSHHSDSFGGASFDSELDLEEMNEANYDQFKLHFRYDDSSDTLCPREDDDTSSLCSEYSSHEVFGSLEDNKGARSLSSMASNLSVMVDQLNSVCSTLDRQTKHNLDFLSGTPPVDPVEDYSTQGSIHSDDLMSMELFYYSNSDEEVGSPVATSPPLRTDDLFPEWHADIYEFIESHVLENKPLTAIDLSKQFADKNLSIKTLKAMYQRVRDNVQRDRRILRRQDLSLPLCSLFQHFCGVDSTEMGIREMNAMLRCREVVLKLTAVELDFAKKELKIVACSDNPCVLPSLDFCRFRVWLDRLPSVVALQIRKGMKENFGKVSPYRMLRLRASEAKDIVVGLDGVIVKSNTKTVKRGWSVVHRESFSDSELLHFTFDVSN